MNITKENLFITLLQRLEVNTRVINSNTSISAGVYKYILKTNTIEKEEKVVAYIGSSFKPKKRVTRFVIEETHNKALKGLQVVNAKTKQIIAIFKHKTESLILI